jgi:nicotinamide-nucleotide amidase
VIEMAQGALALLKTTYSIAVSGIMGPGGGMIEKPVGTVWMAVAGKGKLLTKKMHFRFDREKNIELTAMNALNLLREFINDVAI